MREVINSSVTEKQKRLFLGCQFARLYVDLDVVNKEIEKNEGISLSGNESLFIQLGTAARNWSRNHNREALLKKKEIIEKQLVELSKKHTYSEFAHNYEELEELVKEIYEDDIYGLARVVFSASLAFDGEYKYQYHDKGMRNLSRVIWKDESKLSTIESEISNIYRDLAKQPLSTAQKMLLGGTAALALATFVVPQIAFANITSGGAILGNLATWGGALGAAEGVAAIAGVAAMGAAELALDCALVGFVYSQMSAYNKKEVQKSFRSMTWNDTAHMLAIKCYVMKHAKCWTPSCVYKEGVSDLLQMVQDLKSDTDYFLFVEKENIENNKSKIQVFHNLDKRLMDILAV